MASSLLALIDDIATLLDDVMVMSKVAAQKTAGVLGDDLALNAQQVAGVAAEREVPVVWAVAKGSFINKLILVPAALLISVVAPWAILPLLMIGGLFLCFEGFEKLAHKYLHSAAEDAEHHREQLAAMANPALDLVAFEKDKIRGAIRTDFILSAEIIVITLGTVADEVFAKKLMVLSVIAIVMTVGVYGLVAGIVKLDDLGYWLVKRGAGIRRRIGEWILRAAPLLMKTLSVLGTAAMFMVGGSILAHGIGPLHHGIAHASEQLGAVSVSVLGSTLGILLEALVGVIAGALVLLLLTVGKKLWGKRAPA
ncbi:MAG: DUF808 domain-containing protein [Lysobacterales bacterium]